MTKAERKEKTNPCKLDRTFNLRTAMINEIELENVGKKVADGDRTEVTNAVKEKRGNLSTQLTEGMSIPAVDGGKPQARDGESR